MLYRVVRKFFRAGKCYSAGTAEPFDTYAARDLLVAGLIVELEEGPKPLPLVPTLSASPVAQVLRQRKCKGCGNGGKKKAPCPGGC